MSNALDEHEDAITKMKVALVSAIAKEETAAVELKAARKKIIDDILVGLPALLKEARYCDTIRINVVYSARNIANSMEHKSFVQELKAVLTDLKLEPRPDGDSYIAIPKEKLINLIDAKKLATLI